MYFRLCWSRTNHGDQLCKQLRTCVSDSRNFSTNISFESIFQAFPIQMHSWFARQMDRQTDRSGWDLFIIANELFKKYFLKDIYYIIVNRTCLLYCYNKACLLLHETLQRKVIICIFPYSLWLELASVFFFQVSRRLSHINIVRVARWCFCRYYLQVPFKLQYTQTSKK